MSDSGPSAGRARDVMRCLAASASTARVVVAICSLSVLKSGPMTAAWITWVAARFAAGGQYRLAISTGPCRIASSFDDDAASA